MKNLKFKNHAVEHLEKKYPTISPETITRMAKNVVQFAKLKKTKR